MKYILFHIFASNVFFYFFKICHYANFLIFPVCLIIFLFSDCKIVCLIVWFVNYFGPMDSLSLFLYGQFTKVTSKHKWSCHCTVSPRSLDQATKIKMADSHHLQIWQCHQPTQCPTFWDIWEFTMVYFLTLIEFLAISNNNNYKFLSDCFVFWCSR